MDPHPPSSRTFRWISSTRGDRALLEQLQRRMERFYGRPEAREAYQAFVDLREVQAFDHPFERLLAGYLRALRPATLLEVGCGSGRLYRTLRRAGYEGPYLGIEVADGIVEACRARHPEARWLQAGAYSIPADSDSFDACFSYGVVESFVYPESALLEMLRVLRPGGRLVMLYPDFLAAGHLGSQQTGLTPGRTTPKLKAGRVLDAAVTWYDQKLRLPRALRRALREVGPFPVNLAPVALTHPAAPMPDYDAVYLSSASEIEGWARRRGHAVEYPFGRVLDRALRARSWTFQVVRKG